jgi:hypothetical protein
MEAARLAASGVRMEFGGAVAAGKADFDLDRRNAAVELSMSRLDLDAWPKDPADAPWPTPTLPASWSGSAKLAIEALVWQGGIISQVRSSARLEKGMRPRRCCPAARRLAWSRHCSRPMRDAGAGPGASRPLRTIFAGSCNGLAQSQRACRPIVCASSI